jgi:hypothetical protein
LASADITLRAGANSIGNLNWLRVQITPVFYGSWAIDTSTGGGTSTNKEHFASYGQTVSYNLKGPYATLPRESRTFKIHVTMQYQAVWGQWRMPASFYLTVQAKADLCQKGVTQKWFPHGRL